MILVTGAKGVVGVPLCEALSKSNRDFLSVSRHSNNRDSIQWDLICSSERNRTNLKSSLEGVTRLIHCAPIWLLPANLAFLNEVGVKQIVVFSSTSVLSKKSSQNAHEQSLVTQLADAENKVADFCSLQKIDLTILRPTLIYGYGRDQNVSHIAKFIRRYKFMFLVGKASGLRQPVHADDLVNAALSCLTTRKHKKMIYNLAGRDVLTYREMVERIFNGLGYKTRIFSIPLNVFRLALTCANKLGKFSYTPEMADRMNQDLDYDYSDAERDLGFAPQGFLEQVERDLVINEAFPTLS